MSSIAVPAPAAHRSGAGPRTRRALPRLAVAALVGAALGACAPDAVTDPRPAAARLGTAGAAADSGDAPRDTLLPVPAELDSLFGDAAAPIHAVLATHRATAARTLDSLEAAARDEAGVREADVSWTPPAEPVDSAHADSAGAGRARARAAADPAAAPLLVTRETVDAGGQSYLVEARTRLDPVTDAAAGALALTRDESYTIVPAAGTGIGVRQEMVVRVVLPACPDVEGRVPAEVFAHASAWRRYGMPAGDAAPDAAAWDRRRESTLEGTIAAQVDDDAEVAGYDLALVWRLTYDVDRTTRLDGTARFAAAGLTPTGLAEPLGSRPVVDAAGDYGALVQLGFDERLLYPYARADVARQVAAARARWRGGQCVDVTLDGGNGPRTIDPGQRVDLLPTPKSKVDGALVHPARIIARADGAPTFAPIVPPLRPWPAPYAFTMPDDVVTVDMRAVSRRGIGLRTVEYRPHRNDAGWLTYDASVRYQYDSTDRYGTTRATASGTERIASELRFVFRERTADGTQVFAVHAANRIAVHGAAEVEGREDTDRATFTVRLDGTGTTSNPRAESDPLMNATWTVTAQGAEGSGSAGELRLIPTGDPAERRFIYTLHLFPTQIVPGFAWAYAGDFDCGGMERWSYSVTYSNASRQYVTAVNDPRKCQRWVSDKAFASGPYTFGMLSADRTEPDPVTRRGGFVRGIAVFDGARQRIAGVESRTVTDCEKVLWLDPIQIAALARGPGTIPGPGVNWRAGATCELRYTTQWELAWPSAAR